MPQDYYENILYPLQDKILELVSLAKTDFYLTGGTALSRFYLNHRYSDDLDFFVNNSPGFKSDVEAVLNVFDDGEVIYKPISTNSGFVRLVINDKNCNLKIDFVNDISFRAGEVRKCEKFQRVDNKLNILSNKITALTRYETKDIVDIVNIAVKTEFSWEEIFNDALQKDVWANPVEAAKILDAFPTGKLKEIKWIADSPEETIFSDYISQIIQDILSGKDNSLYRIGK